jgi:hypothetical protein
VGALAEPATLRQAFIKLAFQRFLVTFELKPLGWNRGKGYKLYEPHYCNPAMKQLQIAAVAVTKTKIQRSERV